MNTPLPKSVQRQLDEAARIEQQLAAANAPQPVQPEPPQPSEPPQATAPVEPPTPAPVQTPQPDIWEARYKSLQGILNARMRENQNTVEQLTAQLQELRDKLENGPAAPQQQADTQPLQADPRDAETFGADLVDMVRKYAEQTRVQLSQQFQALGQSLTNRVAALEQTVNGVSTRTAASQEQAFFATLSALVPDWETVNATDEWKLWLQEVDPLFGRSRQDALNDAQQALDAKRAAAVFHLYKVAIAPPVAAPAPRAHPLANQVAPVTTGAVTPPPQQSVQIVSQKEITAFYNDLARGRFKGREQEAARIEQTINQALAENRVR